MLTPTSTIGVVGLGYVGLPLVLAYAAKNYRALGFDIDPAKIDAIHAGRSYIKHIPGSKIADARTAGKLDATSDFARVAECDAIILCVPTPLDEHFEPDLSYVTNILDSVVPHLRAGQTLSLESTTYPGTTEEEVVTRVEAAGFTVGKDVFVVYSPEREDPGNPTFSATNIPKVVGGLLGICFLREAPERAIESDRPASRSLRRRLEGGEMGVIADPLASGGLWAGSIGIHRRRA